MRLSETSLIEAIVTDLESDDVSSQFVAGLLTPTFLDNASTGRFFAEIEAATLKDQGLDRLMRSD